MVEYRGLCILNLLLIIVGDNSTSSSTSIFDGDNLSGELWAGVTEPVDPLSSSVSSSSHGVSLTAVSEPPAYLNSLETSTHTELPAYLDSLLRPSTGAFLTAESSTLAPSFIKDQVWHLTPSLYPSQTRFHYAGPSSSIPLLSSHILTSFSNINSNHYNSRIIDHFSVDRKVSSLEQSSVEPPGGGHGSDLSSLPSLTLTSGHVFQDFTSQIGKTQYIRPTLVEEGFTPSTTNDRLDEESDGLSSSVDIGQIPVESLFTEILWPISPPTFAPVSRLGHISSSHFELEQTKRLPTTTTSTVYSNPISFNMNITGTWSPTGRRLGPSESPVHELVTNPSTTNVSVDIPVDTSTAGEVLFVETSIFDISSLHQFRDVPTFSQTDYPEQSGSTNEDVQFIGSTTTGLSLGQMMTPIIPASQHSSDNGEVLSTVAPVRRPVKSSMDYSTQLAGEKQTSVSLYPSPSRTIAVQLEPTSHLIFPKFSSTKMIAVTGLSSLTTSDVISSSAMVMSNRGSVSVTKTLATVPSDVLLPSHQQSESKMDELSSTDPNFASLGTSPLLPFGDSITDMISSTSSLPPSASVDSRVWTTKPIIDSSANHARLTSISELTSVPLESSPAQSLHSSTFTWDLSQFWDFLGMTTMYSSSAETIESESTVTSLTQQPIDSSDYFDYPVFTHISGGLDIGKQPSTREISELIYPTTWEEYPQITDSNRDSSDYIYDEYLPPPGMTDSIHSHTELNSSFSDNLATMVASLDTTNGEDVFTTQSESEFHGLSASTVEWPEKISTSDVFAMHSQPLESLSYSMIILPSVTYHSDGIHAIVSSSELVSDTPTSVKAESSAIFTLPYESTTSEIDRTTGKSQTADLIMESNSIVPTSVTNLSQSLILETSLSFKLNTSLTLNATSVFPSKESNYFTTFYWGTSEYFENGSIFSPSLPLELSSSSITTTETYVVSEIWPSEMISKIWMVNSSLESVNVSDSFPSVPTVWSSGVWMVNSSFGISSVTQIPNTALITSDVPELFTSSTSPDSASPVSITSTPIFEDKNSTLMQSENMSDIESTLLILGPSVTSDEFTFSMTTAAINVSFPVTMQSSRERIIMSASMTSSTPMLPVLSSNLVTNSTDQLLPGSTFVLPTSVEPTTQHAVPGENVTETTFVMQNTSQIIPTFAPSVWYSQTVSLTIWSTSAEDHSTRSPWSFENTTEVMPTIEPATQFTWSLEPTTQSTLSFENDTEGITIEPTNQFTPSLVPTTLPTSIVENTTLSSPSLPIFSSTMIEMSSTQFTVSLLPTSEATVIVESTAVENITEGTHTAPPIILTTTQSTSVVENTTQPALTLEPTTPPSLSVEPSSIMENTPQLTSTVKPTTLVASMEPTSIVENTTQPTSTVEISTHPMPPVESTTQPTSTVEISTHPMPPVESTESTTQPTSTVEISTHPMPPVESITQPASNVEGTSTVESTSIVESMSTVEPVSTVESTSIVESISTVEPVLTVESTSIVESISTVDPTTQPTSTVYTTEPTSAMDNITLSTSTVDPTTQSSTPTTTPIVTSPTLEPTLNTSTDLKRYWIVTVIKVLRTEDVTTKEFGDKMEGRLVLAYVDAYRRAGQIENGTYQPLERRKRYAQAEDLQLEMMEITRSDTNNDVALVYYMEKGGEAVPAETAVQRLNLFSQQELALKLGYVVGDNARLFEPVPVPVEDPPQYWIIGAVLGSVAGAIVIIWCVLCIYFRCCRVPEDKEPGEGEPHLVGLKDKDFEASHPEATYIEEVVHKTTANGTALNKAPKKQVYTINDEEDPLYAEVRQLKKRPPSSRKAKQGRRVRESVEGSEMEDTTEYVSDAEEDVPTKPTSRKARPRRAPRGHQHSLDSADDVTEEVSEDSGVRTSVHHMRLPPVHKPPRATHNGQIAHAKQSDSDLQHKADVERWKNKQRLREKRRNSRGELERSQRRKTRPEKGEATQSRAQTIAASSREPAVRVEGFVNEAYSESEPEADRHNQESLEQARERMHQLLDDAFSLVSPAAQNNQKKKVSPELEPSIPSDSLSSTLDTSSRPKAMGRFRPQPARRRESTDVEIQELKKQMIGDLSSTRPKPTPRKSTEKKHTPIIIDRGKRLKEVGNNSTSWNPYRVGDSASLLLLPQEEIIQPKVAQSSPVLGRFQATSVKGATPNSYGGMLGASALDLPKSTLTTTEPEPIVITTRKHAWNYGSDPDVSLKYDFQPKDTSTLNNSSSKYSATNNNSKYAALIRELDEDSLEVKHSPRSVVDYGDIEMDHIGNGVSMNACKPGTRMPVGSDEIDVIKGSLEPGVTPEPLIRSIREELIRLSSRTANKDFSSC